MTDLTWLAPGISQFPPSSQALSEPNGLLAAGGDLSCKSLLAAYRRGIFPWFDDSQPILWWTPDPRLVLLPENLHVSKSLAKQLRKCSFDITTDADFAGVMQACAGPRRDANGTWITEEMFDAYLDLHEIGAAHSVEVWDKGTLIGGLYGVALGKVYFCESKFTRVSNASKIAFVATVRSLQKSGFRLIDCQVYTDHLASFGAEELSRQKFELMLADWVGNAKLPSPWPDDIKLL